MDWSGARRGAARRIGWAEGDGTVIDGLDREAVFRRLLNEAERDPGIVVGFDFSFSFPEWFIDDLGASVIEEVWERTGAEGDRWLSECPFPFWGRPGIRRPHLPAHLRRTEESVSVRGIRPKSTFQIGGAGAVGTGSVRGMPFLLRLREAGFSIWPFHHDDGPRVVEIWPRLFTGPVRKSDPAARRRELERRGLRIDLETEDAFDAAISAHAMAASPSLRALADAVDAVARREGEIWKPAA